MRCTADVELHWLARGGAPPGTDALQRSIDAGATIVAIGPLTNLAVLELPIS